MQQNKRTKPDWLKVKLPTGKEYKKIRDIVNKNKLHTICSSGICPNMSECWGNGTATFMILGDICTRSCKFCNVKTGQPNAVDYDEPNRIAESIKIMHVKHCVLTSVDRDDLEDGGAEIWAKTIQAIRKTTPKVTIETLIPDFQGKKHLLDIIIKNKPEVISHNLETTEKLTPEVRSAAKYQRSLNVLAYLEQNGMRIKSGLMLGLGETYNEILQTMDDLRKINCHVLTLGQYLQPTPNHLPVKEYITPTKFEEYKKIGLSKGFDKVESCPLVRSSYHAEKHLEM